jgi:hypothetical protein
MTPAQYEAELHWLGWRAMAQRLLNLRPAEAHALVLMMRHPGRVITFEELAGFDGDGMMHSRCFNGSRGGIVNRIARLRAKLADVGCARTIETIQPYGDGPADGYWIQRAAARVIDRTLRLAAGVEFNDSGRDERGANNPGSQAA